MSKKVKWKRLPNGSLQSRDASVFKNAVGSYFVCVSQILATEEEAKEWAENVLSVDSSKRANDHIQRL